MPRDQASRTAALSVFVEEYIYYDISSRTQFQIENDQRPRMSHFDVFLFISRTSLGELCRRSPLWGLSRRTRAIDHLLYESNSGFWRWVSGGCGNVLSIGVVVIASTRPPQNRLLGLGQP